MALSFFILGGWFACIIACYYVIRPIPNKSIRMILTLFLCAVLTYMSCQNLLQFDLSSMAKIGVCWLTSVRLIHMTVFPTQISLTFQSFLFKILWNFFPILPKRLGKNQWPIVFHLVLVVIKLLINHWIYRWSISCESRISYVRVAMFFLFLITSPFILDAAMILVRILTREKYTLESFTNFPFFSLSLREFWGRRYNQFVSTVLRESVFQPIRLKCSSSVIAGLTAFIISGLFHAHIALVAYGSILSAFQAFIFFFLHGIACGIEANMKIQLPGYVGWFVTHAFLLATAPILMETSIKETSLVLMNNPPPFLNIEWIPKLPVPNFCPP